MHRLAFFRTAYALFKADFYVKADDDIYLRPGNSLVPFRRFRDQLNDFKEILAVCFYLFKVYFKV